MCHRPFHSHSIHTCTSFQSLRNGGEDVYVAVHRGSERKSKPEKENESVQTEYQMRCFVSFDVFFFLSRERQASRHAYKKEMWEKTYLSWTGARRGRGRCRTDRCGGRTVRSWQPMLMLPVLMCPFRTRIHLRWRGMSLVLSHLVALRVVRRVRGRVGGAGRSNRRIYRNLRVRLHLRRIAMVILLSTFEGVRRTCSLSHTWRTAGLGVRRVVVLRLTRQILREPTRARRGWIQTVVRLRCVRGWNGDGSNLGLGRVMVRGADFLLWWILSGGRGGGSSSSRSLFCGWRFRDWFWFGQCRVWRVQT